MSKARGIKSIKCTHPRAAYFLVDPVRNLAWYHPKLEHQGDCKEMKQTLKKIFFHDVTPEYIGPSTRP